MIHHKKIFIALIVANLVALTAYGALISIIVSKGRQATFLEGEAKRETEREQELSGLKELVMNTAVERDTLRSYFLHADNIVSFIEKVESLGERSGVAIDFETVAITEKEGSPLLALRFVTEGLFAHSYYFLRLFESLPYTLSFERVLLKQTGVSEEGGVWEGEYTVNLLSFINE